MFCSTAYRRLCGFTCRWTVLRTVTPLWCHRCYCRYLQSSAILHMSWHMKTGRNEQKLLQSFNLATRVLSFQVFRKLCHKSMYCSANAVWVTYCKCYLRIDSKFKIEICGKAPSHFNRLWNRNINNLKERLREWSHFEDLPASNHCLTLPT